MKKYLKKEWKWVLVAIISGLCYNIFMGMTALCFMGIFEGISEGNVKYTLVSVGALLITNMLFRIFDFFELVGRSKAIEKMNNHLRNDITKNIMSRNFEQLRSKNTGDYISWYMNDVAQAEKLGFDAFFDFWIRITSVLTGAVLLLQFHYVLLIISLLASAIIIFTSKKMDTALQRKSEEVSGTLEKFSENMKEQISGLGVLRSFGHVELFQRRIISESKQLEAERRKFELLRGSGKAIIDIESVFLVIVNYVALIGMGFMGLIPLSLTMGGSNLINMVESGMAALGELRLSIVSAKPYFDKLTYIEEKKEKIIFLKNPISKITFKDVTFGYGDKRILDKVDYSFERGKKYAIIGSSGSGKTTILRLLLGYLNGYEGEIYYDDKELKTIDKDTISQQIAYIEQEVFLFNTTILDNILLGKEYDEHTLRKVLEYSALQNDITQFEKGIETIVGENGNKLSGGQRQRIAVARALYHDCSFLLMDEGTSALDKENARIIEESLLDNKELTLILISHNLSEAQKRKFDVIYQI